MSTTSGQVTTYDFGFGTGAGINREDLSDVIHNIDPFDTPIFTMHPKVRAQAVHHDWPEDGLSAVATGGAVEGADFSAGDRPVPTRPYNICQIFDSDVQVSGTQIEVRTAGITDDYRYQMENAMREIKRNCENRILSVGGTATGTTAAARALIPIFDFLTTNRYQCGATGIDGTGTSAAALSLSNAMFEGILREIYLDGGSPMDVHASPAVKQVISRFSTDTNQRYVIDAMQMTKISTVEVMITVFGRQFIHMNRWVPTGTGSATTQGKVFFLDRSKIKLAFLRSPRHLPIARQGDNVKGMVLMELTIEVINEKGHGVIHGVKNS